MRLRQTDGDEQAAEDLLTSIAKQFSGGTLELKSLYDVQKEMLATLAMARRVLYANRDQNGAADEIAGKLGAAEAQSEEESNSGDTEDDDDEKEEGL